MTMASRAGDYPVLEVDAHKGNDVNGVSGQETWTNDESSFSENQVDKRLVSGGAGEDHVMVQRASVL